MLRSLKRRIRRSRLGGPLRSLWSRIELRRLPDDRYREERDDRAIDDTMLRILRRNSTCIDVGAHTGRVLEMMLRHAPAGEHVAIEALPHLADALIRRYPSVEVHGCALGAVHGMADFNWPLGLEAWSGLRPPQGGEYPGAPKVQRIRVRVERLDDLVEVGADIRLIKIDVEGAELDVLRGAEQMIRRCRPYVVFEFAELHAQPYGTTPEAMYDYLVGLDLVVRSLHGLQRRLSRDRFVALCRRATRTNFDRSSEGNFLATPR
jgi:FkbM family methyltransferase